MSSFRFLLVNLLGGSLLLLLLTAVCEAQYYDTTPSSDYDGDYNATFEYSFFSNTSSDDLEKFRQNFLDVDEEERTEENTDGPRTETETMETPLEPTKETRINVSSSASHPISLNLWTQAWTFMILMVLNTLQL